MWGETSPYPLSGPLAKTVDTHILLNIRVLRLININQCFKVEPVSQPRRFLWAVGIKIKGFYVHRDVDAASHGACEAIFREHWLGSYQKSSGYCSLLCYITDYFCTVFISEKKAILYTSHSCTGENARPKKKAGTMCEYNAIQPLFHLEYDWIQNIYRVYFICKKSLIKLEAKTGNVTSPEFPGVIAGVKVADLLKGPAAKLKQILSFRYVIPSILIKGRQQRRPPR